MEFWNTPDLLRPNGRKPWKELTDDQRRKRRKMNKDYLVNLGSQDSASRADNELQIALQHQIERNTLNEIVDENLNKLGRTNTPIHKENTSNENNIAVVNEDNVSTNVDTIIARNSNYIRDIHVDINVVPNSATNLISVGTPHLNNNNNSNAMNNNDKQITLKVPTSTDSKEETVIFNLKSFQHDLAKCVVNNKMNLVQSKAILNVLRTHPQLKTLPKDPRTLIKTPREKINTKIVTPGEYLHLGLKSKLLSILSQIEAELIPTTLLIDFSTDGGELNSVIQMWPIQIRLVNVSSSTDPELVGIYVGKSKPDSFVQFFEDFVEEIKVILKAGGIKFNNKLIPIKLRCFIADAPARAYVLGTISHNGTQPCSKCTVQGISHKNAKRFQGVDFEERTDDDFRNQKYVKHNIKKSAIHDLEMDLVKQVPFDYMHMVCLGVMKKFIESTCFGKCSIGKLQDFELRFLNNRLITLQNYCPREFARNPREIERYTQYKATEFRQLLLYTFIVAFPRIITREQYDHFLLLHTSMRILLNDSSSTENVNFADESLKKFVLDAKAIHGLEFLTYNSHGILHLVKDYQNFGSLEGTSAFPYENCMRKYAGYVKKPNQPLQQIQKRTSEESIFKSKANSKTHKTFKARESHENGPVIKSMLNYGCKQYENLETLKFYYSIQNNDNTVLTSDNRIGLIRNIIFCKGKYFLAVQFFKKLEKFYTIRGKPSTDFGVFLCSQIDLECSYILYSEVRSKCYRMPVWVNKQLTSFVNDEQLNNAYVAVEMLL